VAANLGITVGALNDGFSAARKALITVKIDKALKNGDIDADQADELKSDLDDASLPGYKSVGRGGRLRPRLVHGRQCFVAAAAAPRLPPLVLCAETAGEPCVGSPA
jgi:hypothetical protein